MKVGDLVTLSSYALQLDDLWKWRETAWRHGAKKPLVGLVVRIEESPYADRRWTSQNERRYYHVKWMQPDGPLSRWGSTSPSGRNKGYFYRNDLKFVKQEKTK
tara:strand:- start:650 stop:958 length:309 start_codon:yes stop_codon:yes gene_type:complete